MFAAQPSAARLLAVSSTPTTIDLDIDRLLSRAEGGWKNHLGEPNEL
jgi:hypothetical protein